MASKEQQIQQMLEPTVAALGFDLWGVEYLSQGRHSVLRVYIEHEKGISVDDCAAVSEQISGVLDVEDPVKGDYSLEVSSPGLDRPLFEKGHFEQFVGRVARVKLNVAVEGRSNYKGTIIEVDGDEVVLQVEGESVRLPLAQLSSARLVPQF